MNAKLLRAIFFVALVAVVAMAVAGPGRQAPVVAAPPASVQSGDCYYTYLPLMLSGSNGGVAPAGPSNAPDGLDCEKPPLDDIIDFDADGKADLAIGIPEEDASALVLDSGAIQIIYGDDAGLNSAGNQYWTQTNIFHANEAGDEFGRGIAAADFDGDGATDLAVGAPGQDRAGMNAVGQVNIIYGFPTTGLTANGTQTFAQGIDGVIGVGEDGDRFGETLATGDFNGDGYADLAIGAPDEDYESGGVAEMGAVNVLYGSQDGLTTAGNQIFHLALSEVTGSPSPLDHFGQVLASGDFDNDDYDDLAISIPGYDIAGADNVGIVMVFMGSDSGLSYLDETLWRQGFNGIEGAAEADDGFGTALAVGDFDQNGASDLAVGVPGEDVAFNGSDVLDAGAINIIYGFAVAGGLSGSGDQIWHQGLDEVLFQPNVLDRFGAALAAADYDGDGADDLAVGVPFEDGTEANQGFVQVFYSNGSILSTDGQDFWTQGLVIGAPELDDYFGYSLTAGDYDGDTHSDLVVGVPYEDVLDGGVQRVDAGAINVIYGSASGLGAAGNQIWTQGSGGLPGAPVASDRFGEFFSR